MRFSSSLVALLISSSLLAQTTGSISGRVLDEEGNPVAAASLSARSPSLQGERLATTATDGRFRMPGLPPGEYEVSASVEGFRTVGQIGVLLPIGREITMEFRLPPSFREELTVLGAPPLLDVTSAATGTIVERETFERLAIGRSYESLAFLAPGVVSTPHARTSPSIAGASAAENRYIVDGLDETDTGFGWLTSTLPPEFLEVVEIKTGGYGPEYGGALGGVLNVLTRTGGNQLHSTLFGYYENDGFGSDPPRSSRNEQFLASKTYDYGGTVGGRIIRDRLWYFLGLNPTSEEREWVTSQGLSATDEADGLAYAGKLTWQIDRRHRLTASASGDPRENTWNTLFAAGRLQTLADNVSHHFAFSFDALPLRQLTLELFAGRYEQRTKWSPAADRPWYIEYADGQFARAQDCGDPDLVVNGMSFAFGCLGGTWVYDNLDQLRDEARGSATWYGRTGRLDHEVKAGVTLREVKFRFNVHYPAPASGPFFDSAGILVDPGGLTGQRWLLTPAWAQLQEREQDGSGRNEELALFLRDEISIGGRWTIQLGVRAEAFDSTGTKTEQDGRARLKFGLEDMIAPRLGLVWDPIGKGRAKLFAHFARYYESVPLYLNTRVFADHRNNFYTFLYPENGALPSAQNPGTLIFSRSEGGAGNAVASHLHPQHNDEYLLGFECQFGQNVSVGLTGVYRQVGDVLEDFSIDDLQSYIVGNPGGTITRHPVTGAPLEEPVSFAEPERTYRALQLNFRRRLRGTWQLGGSYVFSKNEGNYSGLSQQDIGQSAPNLTADFDLPELSHNATGPLPNDRTHQAKLYGSYQWAFGLISGFFAQYVSGTPLSKRGYHAFFGPLRFVTPRGSAGRTPDLFTMDLRTEYPLRLTGGLTLSVFADVFNLTDNQEPIFLDDIWTYAGSRRTEDPNECGGPRTGPGTDCPAGNPDWGKPILFHTPRTLRIGARLSW